MNAMHFKNNWLRKYEMKWFYYKVKFFEFIFLNHYKFKSLFFHVFTFNAGHIGFETSSVWVSLSIFVFSSWIFSSLDGDASLASSILNIQIVVYFMMVFRIYMVAPSSTSSLCKYCRILVIVAFFTSFEYPPVTRKASIRFSGSTSFLQYNACCCSDLCSIKCLRHLVQKCFFIDFQ